MTRGQSFFLVTALAASASACFAGYDSRWGQSKQVQRQMAQSEAPTLRAEPPAEERPAAAKTHRVHAYVTRTFTAQVADVPKSLRELFDDANDVMEPLAGVHLELDGIRTWELANDDDLGKTLAELRTSTTGDDASWIVGFVSALPKATASFHDAGMADLPGKHIVVRAPSNAMRHDAIDRAYGDLPANEREELHRRDRRHRAAAVFLHEIGHTLGALHERSEASLMFPEYRSKMRTFGEASSATMRLLVDRRDPKTIDAQADLFATLAEQWRAAPQGSYFEDERTKHVAQAESLIGRARAKLASPPPPPAAAAAPAEPDDLDPVSTADRALFADARAKLAARDHVHAWESAKPLFERYPDVMSIQDFRCQLASQVFSFDTTRRECERLMQLAKRPSKR